jgi:WD40 repeat protein
VAFHPDGTRLAGACEDGAVRLWELTKGREVLRFEGSGGPALAVAFDPTGRRLAATDRGGTTRVWTSGPRR